MIESMYQVLRESQSHWVPLRGCRYHVRQWGTATPGATPLVLAHGWMDVAASYQFMVDAFSEAFVSQRPIIAMDWRGYGLTETPPTDSYWFPDYLADLDALLDTLYPDQPVDLVGHSMGGNVVMMYAGSRPERIRRLVNLEGFGMATTQPAQAPTRMAQWLDELKAQRLASPLPPSSNTPVPAGYPTAPSTQQAPPPPPAAVKTTGQFGRCRATTQKGTQCSRNAKSNGYCYQHGGV